MLGTDFEVFVYDEISRRTIPSTRFGLGGKRDAHMPLSLDDKPVGTMHRDNVMLELCVPPAKNAPQFCESVNKVLEAAVEWLSTQGRYHISTATSARFGPVELNTPEGTELGCDVDFLVRDQESAKRIPPNAQSLGNIRHSGGHVHVSWSAKDIPAWVGARICDLLIGMPEIPLLNKERANAYGHATLHRPTKYPDGSSGVEYRVLDSYWVHDRDTIGRIASSAELVMSTMENASHGTLSKLIDMHQKAVPFGQILCQMDRDTANNLHFEARAVLAAEGIVQRA